MALVDSRNAIGAISDLLKTRLTMSTSATTADVGRPEAAAASSGPKLNLFLYQIEIDGHLRNVPLDQGQPPPVWVVLHYLLTAFDVDKESDSVDAHELLGEGMLALHELNLHQPTASQLRDNPEPLAITFDDADAELVSKIMQSSDEKYRVSVGLQVRPVMIAPSVPPGYALPVTSVGPPTDEGVVVIPSLGPKLDNLEPEKFEAGTEITLTGADVGTQISEIRLGDVSFGVTSARPGAIKAVIDAATELSPGSYPVRAVRVLPGNQQLTSNALLAHLLPTLTTAVPEGLTTAAGAVSGRLTLTGHHLGTAADSIFVAFYGQDRVALMLEATGIPAQDSLDVTVSVDEALPAGDYRIILRVNGEQARNAPLVSWT